MSNKRKHGCEFHLIFTHNKRVKKIVDTRRKLFDAIMPPYKAWYNEHSAIYRIGALLDSMLVRGYLKMNTKPYYAWLHQNVRN